MKKLFTLSIITLMAVSFQTMAQSCSDLFISEYVEGSSFNKVIEIYNPTTGTVQLDGYQLLLFSNGTDTASFKFNLHGDLLSHDVYVISHSDADSASVLSIVDTTNLVCNWNGNDAVALVNKITADTLDIIGVIGEDPGTEWTVGSGSTKDHTLVRMIDVQEGTTDWTLGSTQWDVYPLNDFSHLGSHDMTPCATTIPELAISTDSAAVPESVGTFNIKVSILNPNTNATSGDVIVSGGTATLGTDYNFSNQTVTFPSGSSTPAILSVSVVNDGTTEPDETIELTLQNPTNGATIAASSVTIKILDDDGLGISSSGSASAVSIFPNPAGDVLNIRTAQAVDEVRLENILGEEVVQLVPTNKHELVLQLDQLQQGIYFLKIYSEGSVIIKQVIKK